MAKAVSDEARLPLRGPGAKTVLLVFLSVLATALVMSAMEIHSSYERLRRTIGETQSRTLEWSAERLLRRVEQGRTEIAAVARSDALRTYGEFAGEASTREAPDSGLERILSRALEPSRTFSGAVVLDAKGRIRAAVGSGPELGGLLEALAPKNAVDTELLDVMKTVQLRRDLAAVEAPVLHAFDAKGVGPCLIASSPLRDPNGHPLGSLHGLLRRDELSAQLRSDLLGDGSLYLTNATGAIIAAAANGVGASPDPPAAGSAPQVRTFWIGDETWAVTSELPVGVLGWTLVARQTALQAFRPLQAVLARTVAASAIAVVLSTLLAAWVAGGMSRRLQTLFDATRHVARGDLDVNLPAAEVHGQFEAVFSAFNAMTRRLREARDQTEAGLFAIRKQNQAFQKQHSVLSMLSVTDGLTELHNHRYFQEQLGREIKRLARRHEGLSMLIIDIDDFKQLNDRFGHAAGDEFLKQLARILKESVRDTDLLARYGGEEFVIVATGTVLSGAIVLAEKIRTKIAETSFILDSSMRLRRATVSIGVAEYKRSRTEFFTGADAALYRAKASGKNCVVAAEPEADEA